MDKYRKVMKPKAPRNGEMGAADPRVFFNPVAVHCGWPVLDCCKNKVKDDSENWIAAEISYQGWPENRFLDCSP